MTDSKVVNYYGSYLILCTVTYLSTSILSLQLLPYIRICIILYLGFCIILDLIKLRVGIRVAWGVGFYLIIYCYGVFLSVLNGGIDIIGIQVFRDFLMIGLGVYLLNKFDLRRLGRRAAIFLYWYFCVSTLFLVLVGGISFNLIDFFVFDGLAELTGKEEGNYSLGISNFFGLASIVSIFIFVNDGSVGIRRFFYVVTFFVFIAFSFLGGGRGDSVFALLVSVFLLVMKYKVKFLLPGIIVGLAFFYLISSDLLSDLLVYKRFFEANEFTSGRADLYDQSIMLLEDNASCLLIGCGFDYFQKYYGYDHSFYPHNFILESVIVFGLPLVALIFVIVCFGLIEYKKSTERFDLSIIIFIYLFLVSMKSGSVTSAWVLVSYVVYFFIFAIAPKSMKHVKSPPDLMKCSLENMK